MAQRVMGHLVGKNEAESAGVSRTKAGVHRVVNQDHDFAAANAQGGGIEAAVFDDENMGNFGKAEA